MSQENKNTLPKRGVPWGWIVTGLLVATGITLILSNNSESNVQYYMTVSEYLERQERYQGKRIKIAGIVKAKTLKKSGTTQYDFVVEDLGKEIEVSFNGLAPDTFKEGAEVVVDGKGSFEKVFLAETLMAKCASKYKEGGLPPLEQMRKNSRI